MQASSASALAARWRADLAALGPGEVAGRALAAAAVLIAFGAWVRGFASPFPNGHFASNAAIGMCADNMWRWKTLLPVVGYVERPPGLHYYMHHPLGVFWVTA